MFNKNNSPSLGNQQNTDVITSTTASSMVRLFGEYLHLMKVLNPIMEKVYQSFIQLTEFYVSTFGDHFFFSKKVMF